MTTSCTDTIQWHGEWCWVMQDSQSYVTKTSNTSAKSFSRKCDAMGKSSCLPYTSSSDVLSWGAVLEEFEVRDALESVFYTKQMGYPYDVLTMRYERS